MIPQRCRFILFVSLLLVAMLALGCGTPEEKKAKHMRRGDAYVEVVSLAGTVLAQAALLGPGEHCVFLPPTSAWTPVVVRLRSPQGMLTRTLLLR